MRKNINIFNFDDVYKKQDFYKDDNYNVISLKDICGTNSYCDDNARKCLKKRIEDINLPNISFIGSGNYHYVSLFLIEKIKEDFTLVLFDNHTDMQKPLFEELISCGGWVRTALLTDCYLKQVIIIGTSSTATKDIDNDIKDKVTIIDKELISNNEKWSIMLSNIIKYPVYISIDKDVFSDDLAKTNWDHGDMSLKNFLKGFECIKKKCYIIGMDVCGEYQVSCKEIETLEFASYTNNKLNKRLLDLYKNL